MSNETDITALHDRNEAIGKRSEELPATQFPKDFEMEIKKWRKLNQVLRPA
jgi:hypothetical protein